MFGMKVKIQDKTKNVEEAEEKARFENLGHAAFSIRKAANESIDKRKGPSKPGEPPHTRQQRGHNIKTAIFADVGEYDAVIGPRESWVGDVGQVLEQGGERGGEDIEARPFMAPQLEAAAPRIPEEWQGTIGE